MVIFAIMTILLNFAESKGRPNGGMVDTRDLKSLGHYGCVGSSPTSGTLFGSDSYESEPVFIISAL